MIFQGRWIFPVSLTVAELFLKGVTGKNLQPDLDL
jgi:hypothetical protein